jgi:hypothetical protein
VENLARYGSGVKQLEVLILAFGVLGVAMEVSSSLGAPAELVRDPELLVETLAFATPVVAGTLAVTRGPRLWHAALALVGFAVAAARLKVWILVPQLMNLSSLGKLLAIAAIGGAVASALAVLTWRRAQTVRPAETSQG